METTTTKKAATKKSKNAKEMDVKQYMSIVEEVFAEAREKMKAEAPIESAPIIEVAPIEAPIESAPIIDATPNEVVESAPKADILTFVALVDDKINFHINSSKVIFVRKINPDGTFIKKGINYQYNAEQQQIFQIAAPAKPVKIKTEKINAIKIDDKNADGLKLTPVLKAAMNLKPSTIKYMKAEAPVVPIQSEFSINQRFEFLDKFTNMVLDGVTASVIITGEGGLGKTHTVMNVLKERSMEEIRDYVVIKGYATPKALYTTLFDNKDKAIIFDDCDSVLKDPTSINLLKGALDSYEKRTISWLQKGFIPSEYPASFEFTGQIIFISNMNSSKLDDAVKSRSIVIDLDMTITDRIDRMRFILADILPQHSMDIKEAALNFMEANATEAREFNLRTLQKATKVIKSYGLKNNWQDAVKYLLVSI